MFVRPHTQAAARRNSVFPFTSTARKRAERLSPRRRLAASRHQRQRDEIESSTAHMFDQQRNTCVIAKISMSVNACGRWFANEIRNNHLGENDYAQRKCRTHSQEQRLSAKIERETLVFRKPNPIQLPFRRRSDATHDEPRSDIIMQ